MGSGFPEFKGENQKVINCKKSMLFNVLQKYDSTTQCSFAIFLCLKTSG